MTTERDDDHGGTDRGTIVEFLDGARPPSAAAPRHTVAETVPGPAAAPVARATSLEPRSPVAGGEPPFVPVLRPPVPLLTILDDGELSTGQTLRLRDETTVIGRADGDVRLPHDPLVSGRHAEIVRRGRPGDFRWLLRDLGSTNGTFVACTRAPLRPDRLLLVGGRRYLFRPPPESPAAAGSGGTLSADMAASGVESWPALLEVGRAAAGRPVEIPLRGTNLVVGRAGAGNDVGLDDPLVAAQAARIFVDAAGGGWQIEALPSRNGLWMQILEVVLAPTCRFQVGEQRFLFVV